jgi:hypothetical protein
MVASEEAGGSQIAMRGKELRSDTQKAADKFVFPVCFVLLRDWLSSVGSHSHVAAVGIGLPPRKSDSQGCGTVTNQEFVQPHEVDFYASHEIRDCAVAFTL